MACCRRVASPVRWKGKGYGLDPQAQALGLDRLGKDGGQVAQQAGNVERRFLQSELAGLDLRDVEDIIDDRQQVPGGGVDGVEALCLLGRHAFATQDIRHADDAVHRGADFVAHVGEEGALGDVGGFGLLALLG